jgi:hypothetical protein
MTSLPRRGDRIRLVAMKDDPNPIQVGQLGTVVGIYRQDGGTWYQIDVAWDNGRKLMLSSPPDEFQFVESGA